MAIRARAFCVTINNWTAEDREGLSNLSRTAAYAVFGEEVGEKTGTPHLQGYLYFKNARSENSIRKALPRARTVPANGDALSNTTYCSKGANVEIHGTMPKQGDRTDIEEIRDVLAETPRMAVVVDVARSVQAVKIAQEWLKYHEAGRKWETEVYWFYGPTGCGKSRGADEMAPDAYRSMGTNKWWEGYDGHPDVIIDDMRRDFCKFHELLRLTDRYPYRVETKGGSRQFLARRIFITSCYSPEEMFETREDVGQLMRRIKNIRAYQEDHSFITIKGDGPPPCPSNPPCPEADGTKWW